MPPKIVTNRVHKKTFIFGVDLHHYGVILRLMNKTSSTNTKTKDAPQVDLLAVRIELLKRRHTWASWARKKGLLTGTLHNAATGRRTGPMSRRIVETLLRDLGIRQ
jgi:hypothetical protein